MIVKIRLTIHALILLGLLGASASATELHWVSESRMQVAGVEATAIDDGDDISVFNGFKSGVKIAKSVEKIGWCDLAMEHRWFDVSQRRLSCNSQRRC